MVPCARPLPGYSALGALGARGYGAKLGKQVAGETITSYGNHGDAVSGGMQKRKMGLFFNFKCYSFPGRYPAAHLGGGKTRLSDRTSCGVTDLPAKSLNFLQCH